MARVLLTGAAGGIGRLLVPRLTGHELRLLDIRPPAVDGWLAASATDLDAMTDACAGVDAVVHLGGQSREAPAEEVLHHNAFAAYAVLEAARRAGVSRVVLASSNHAAGFYERGDAPPGGLPADVPVRPDTLYGWSKAAVEAAGRLYADRFGMDVICLRIGLCCEVPDGPRHLAMWLSADDCARLVEACLSAPAPGYRIVWGVSRNSRRWWSLAAGEAIGYHPKDDAEEYAEQIIAVHGPPDYDGDPVLRRSGGQWCDIPLGVPN
ncbi:NAD-dependent epimerase/dehydratase family protein [Phytohabitans rumicis]|uniref:NAD-dependent dehydratase n=1 Tax=Phytohabitans rumicis TaxID=1076125 RepID=A0A6V8LKQ7_9ACTN|nr:NAD(P)-dependent oxidoreductase [Phytohabitans rumicis]GFJ96150.1 NAD-dependent dehydratase [Phytohabitans rumicis]